MSSVRSLKEQNIFVPFDPQLFVDREEEKELFFESVRATRQQRYLEFTGIAGQGKSEFLKWICYAAKEETYIAAYIDFELPTYQRPELYPILETILKHFEEQIFSDIFRDFKKQLDRYTEDLREFYLASWSDPHTAVRNSFGKLEESLIMAFKDALNTILRSHKIVLCLDGTEKAYLGALYSFEEQILKYYTTHVNFMLVTAGQTKMTWKTKEITDRMKRHKLLRLDSEGVFEQVQSLARKKDVATEDTELISDKMLQLTLGHPFSNYKLVDFWTKSFEAPLNESVVNEQFGRGIQELVEQVIETRILRKLKLGPEYPPVGEILWYLASLRHIDFSTLWYMLPIFFKNCAGKSFDFFEKLIDQFKHTYIFTPWQGIGFDIEPVVRNILLWDMRINAPKEFLNVQKILMSQYNEFVKRTYDVTQIKNIVERLYHYALYLKETQPNNTNEPVQKELECYLQDYFTLKFIEDKVALREQLNRLYSTLENDKELAILTNVSALLSIVQEFKK